MIDVRRICNEVAERHGLLPKQVYFAFRFHQRYVLKMIMVNTKAPKLPDDFSPDSEPMTKDEFKSMYPDIVLPGFAKFVIDYSSYLIWFGGKKKALANRLRHKEVYSGNRTHMTTAYYCKIDYYRKKYEECEHPDKKLRMRYINALKQMERRRALVKETIKIKSEEYDKKHRKGTCSQEDQAAVHEDSHDGRQVGR